MSLPGRAAVRRPYSQRGAGGCQGSAPHPL